MPDFSQDRGSSSRPNKRARVFVVLAQVVMNRFDEFSDASKRSSTDPLASDLCEPPFHKVQPRTAHRYEVQVEPRMILQPLAHLRVLVGAVVVHDQVDLSATGCLPIDALEKSDEFGMAVPRLAGSDHSPIQHIERGKQSGGPMSNVVMGLPSGNSWSQRQDRRGSIQ